MFSRINKVLYFVLDISISIYTQAQGCSEGWKVAYPLSVFGRTKKDSSWDSSQKGTQVGTQVKKELK